MDAIPDSIARTDPIETWFRPTDDINHEWELEPFGFSRIHQLHAVLGNYVEFMTPANALLIAELHGTIQQYSNHNDVITGYKRLTIESSGLLRFIRSAELFSRIKFSLDENFIRRHINNLLGQKIIPTGPTIRFERNNVQYVVKTNYSASLSGDGLTIILAEHVGVRPKLNHDDAIPTLSSGRANAIKIFLDNRICTGFETTISNYLIKYLDWKNYLPVTREFFLRWIFADDEMYQVNVKPIDVVTRTIISNQCYYQTHREISRSVYTNSIAAKINSDGSSLRLVLFAGMPYLSESSNYSTMSGLHIHFESDGDYYRMKSIEHEYTPIWTVLARVGSIIPNDELRKYVEELKKYGLRDRSSERLTLIDKLVNRMEKRCAGSTDILIS